MKIKKKKSQPRQKRESGNNEREDDEIFALIGPPTENVSVDWYPILKTKYNNGHILNSLWPGVIFHQIE